MGRNDEEGDYYITLMILHCGHGPYHWQRTHNIWYIQPGHTKHEVELRNSDLTGKMHWDSAHEAACAYCKFYNLIPTEVTTDGG